MNFSTESFLPHGQCLLWDSGLLWMHVISDATIALSYFAISGLLIYLVGKRKDLSFPWVFSLFGSFILLCGATHVVGVVILWNPVYWVAGAVKLLTAAVSLVTAVLLVPLMPKLLVLPTPTQLKVANQLLREEIERHAGTDKIFQQQSKQMKESHAELIQFNRVAVGRELRMIELKNQINQLCLELGKPLAYDLTQVGQEG